MRDASPRHRAVTHVGEADALRPGADGWMHDHWVARPDEEPIHQRPQLSRDLAEVGVMSKRRQVVSRESSDVGRMVEIAD